MEDESAWRRRLDQWGIGLDGMERTGFAVASTTRLGEILVGDIVLG